MQPATSNHTLVQDSKSRISIRAGVEASLERQVASVITTEKFPSMSQKGYLRLPRVVLEPECLQIFFGN